MPAPLISGIFSTFVKYSDTSARWTTRTQAEPALEPP
jgi:hypothetical protein